MATKTFKNPINIINNINSTSYNNGALICSGGIGVTGNIHTGGYIGVNGATANSSYQLNVSGSGLISNYLGINGAVGNSTNVINVNGNVNCSGTFYCGKVIKNLAMNAGSYLGFGAVGTSTFPLAVGNSMFIHSFLDIGTYTGYSMFNVNNGYNGGIQMLDPAGCLNLYFSLSNFSYKIYSGSGCYVASAFYAGTIYLTSDMRIKKNIEIINDNEALMLIRNIYPKRFKYIDDDKDMYKLGFIAQEINDVMPYSINISREFIPNINSQANVTDHSDTTKSIITLVNGEFPFNEILDNLIIRSRNSNNIEIQIIPLEIISNISIIVKKINEHTLFIYGTRVDDYLTINPNNINVTFISAFQDLIRQFEIEQNISNDISNRLLLLENA